MKKALLAILAVIGLVAVTSIVVWKSSGDDSRRQGALEGSEAVALSWRGDWSDEAQYARGNVVSLEGTSYVAEGEKLAKPELGCTECGWAILASEAETVAPPPPAPATLTSPNGSFKIEVKDTGISLTGPNNVSVLLTADSLIAELPKEFKVQSAVSLNLKSGGTLVLDSASNGFFKSSLLTLGCTSGSRSVARTNDTVSGSTIVSGSSKVFAC